MGLYSPLSLNSNSSSGKILPKKKSSCGEDQALVDFMFFVGKEYHRKSSIRAGKNNGCRPISHSEVKDRISQRGITLIGSSDRKNKVKKSNNNNRMRRKKWKKKDGASLSPTQHNSSVNNNNLTLDTLMLMNKHWNQYIQKYLGFEKLSQTTTNPNNLKHMEGSKVEWVGSKVKVTKSLSNGSYVGTKGYLIEDTKCTWRIAILKKNKNKKKHSLSKSKHFLAKTCLIPKNGSKLEVCIPMIINDTVSNDKQNSKTLYIEIGVS